MAKCGSVRLTGGVDGLGFGGGGDGLFGLFIFGSWQQASVFCIPQVQVEDLTIHQAVPNFAFAPVFGPQEELGFVWFLYSRGSPFIGCVQILH